MPNHTANGKFAVLGLPAMEADRFEIKPAGDKGNGVFLQMGQAFDKGWHMMTYGGKKLKTDPKKSKSEYMFTLRNGTVLDASDEDFCRRKGELSVYCRAQHNFLTIRQQESVSMHGPSTTPATRT